MNLDLIASRINPDYLRSAPALVSKYLPFLPVKDYSNFVSLKEGGTPLIKSHKIGPELGTDLYFKVESKNPTGSFKDRGTAVEVTVAKELGASAIAVASTGNMAASCCCYAASQKIPCFVFVPEDVPESKLAQVISFGGKIVQVKGSYSDAARLAEEAAERLNFYLAGDYAFRVEGQKTAAYEVCEQLYFNPPDYLISSMGCGTNISAYAKGFNEFHELGFINQKPAIIGVQAEGAAAIVKSFESKSDTVLPLESVDTIASAIAVARPLDGLKALNAVRESGGFALSVSDREILEAQYRLSSEEGLFVEPSAAATVAALIKKSREYDFQGAKIVCVLSGDGLKDPASVLRVALKPAAVHASVDEFVELYESKFFDGRTVAFIENSEVLFESPPELEEIAHVIARHFDASYPEEYLDEIHLRVMQFFKKGKKVTFADFQDILQNTLESVRRRADVRFKVRDFDVRTAKDTPPDARVFVEVDGETVAGRARGVGPVDAVIKALRAALQNRIEFELKSYKVDIRSRGTDAVVYVEMKLNRNGLVSLGRGASPDIIQASIEAFESAYNGFYEHSEAGSLSGGLSQ
ncbi:MAG: threonine synthase [Candidatus Dadabacteria bacterium]|nr:MAG: threonine synthase [Candidatus Dadabacteria bacterium]